MLARYESTAKQQSKILLVALIRSTAYCNGKMCKCEKNWIEKVLCFPEVVARRIHWMLL